MNQKIRQTILTATLAMTLPMTSPTWSWGQPSGVRNQDRFEITRLFCWLRESAFLTQLYFKNQWVGDQMELTAELANYSISPLGSRKYLSGVTFTRLSVSSNKISGDAGNPADLKGKFFLTRLDPSPNGRWAYQYYRTEFDLVRAIFTCSYNDSPSSNRRRPLD